MPAFLERYDGMTTVRANDVFGTLTVVAGFAGTFAGGFLGDYLLRYTKHAYLWVSGLCMFLGAPVAVLGLAARDANVCRPAIFLAEFFVFFKTGPANAILANVTHPAMRATGFALNILVIHILGDAASPFLIGAIADRWSLNAGFVVVSAFMLLGGIFWLFGAPYLDRDTAAAPHRLDEAGTQ